MRTTLAKFLEQVQDARNNMNNNADYITSPCPELSIDTLVRLQIQPLSKNHIFFSKLYREIEGEGIQYSRHIIAKDSRGHEIEVNKYGRPCWICEGDYEVGIPFLDRPLTGEERLRYPGFIGSSMSTVLYNPTTGVMLKQGESQLSRMGIVFMNIPSKEGDINSNEKLHTEGCSLQNIYTTRSNKTLRKLQSASFLGSICRMSDDTRSYFVKSSEKSLQVKTDKNGDKGFQLSDFCVILDIDNGAQIEAIKAVLANLPKCLIPQIIIEEIGLEGTKKGNASAIIAFDKPLTSIQRRQIIDGVRMHIACMKDIFAIDSKCSGTNLFKNPLKLKDNTLQRYTHIHKNQNSRSLEEALTVTNEYVKAYEDIYSKEAEKWIIENNLKYSNRTYSSLVQEYIEHSKHRIDDMNHRVDVDMNNLVPVGIRNDTLVKELSAMLLQEYNRIGYEAAFTDATTPHRVLKALWPMIKSGYANPDGQINWKTTYAIIKWSYEKDLHIFFNGNDNVKHDLYVKTSMQRVQMLKFNHHQLMDAYGLVCESENDLYKLPQLKGIYNNKISRSRAQILHGAETNMIKGIIYLFASYKGNLLYDSITIRRYARDHKLNLMNYSDTDSLRQFAYQVLSQYCDKSFTPQKADELANYLCLYTSACQYSMSNVNKITKSKSKLTERLKTGMFRIDKSCHLLYNKMQYCRAIKNMLESLINFNRENGEYIPTAYKDITRKSCINKLFRDAWVDKNLDWSSCAMSLTFIHREHQNLQMIKNSKRAASINISALYRNWTDTMVAYIANMVVSNIFAQEIGINATKLIMEEEYADEFENKNAEEVIKMLEKLVGAGCISSAKFIGLVRYRATELQQRAALCSSLSNDIQKIIQELNVDKSKILAIRYEKYITNLLKRSQTIEEFMTQQQHKNIDCAHYSRKSLVELPENVNMLSMIGETSGLCVRQECYVA